MRRLLIPFTLAILSHVLLLRLHGDWVQKRPFQAQPAPPIALALTYVKPVAPSLPSLSSPQEVTREKIQTPEKQQEIHDEKPPAPKPEDLKRKPPETRKKTREPVKKETLLPNPRPEPSAATPLSASSALETRPETPALGPASPQQTSGVPSPPRRESDPDGERQVAALTPAKALKEAVPIYRQNPPPGYPRLARRKGYEGTVVLEVLVGREGQVSDLRVFQSCGHAVLDEAAADSVRSWLFDPGKLDNDPVEMWVKVPVRFQLKK
jgi:protein TonB